MPGYEGKEKEERGEQENEPEKYVQGTAPRGRKNDANWFHGGALRLVRPHRDLPRASRLSGRGVPEQILLSGAGGGFWSKTGRGNLGVDSLSEIRSQRRVSIVLVVGHAHKR